MLMIILVGVFVGFKLDQIYPKGFLVGIVLSAKKESGTLQKIEVSLSSQMQKLEEVLILTKESTG